MKMPLGANLSSLDRRDIIYASVMQTARVIYPAVFSRRTQQSPVVNQYYGSCVGFTGKDRIEAKRIRQNKFVPISGRGAYILCKQNDNMPDIEGTDPRTLMKVLVNVGAPLESDLADEPKENYQNFLKGLTDLAVANGSDNTLDSGYASLLSIEDIKHALQQYGEVPITISVYEDYLTTDSRGVVQQPTGALVGYHEVLAIGWDDLKGLEIKNHWGTGWGDQGFAFLPYSYNGQKCFAQAYSAVDFVSPATKGAPMNLVYPIANPVVTQKFGDNFLDPDGKSHYPKYGLAGHEGVDFRATTGTKVLACDDGKIIFSGVQGAYGNCIIIQHSWGTSLYAHLKDFVITDAGTPSVKSGQTIADSGATGDASATGAHLHFGIKINGVSNPAFKDWIDPSHYLGKGKRMLVFFQVKGSTTIWVLMDGTWVGFADPTAFNNYVAGRPNVVIQLDQSEFAKLQTNPDVFKV